MGPQRPLFELDHGARWSMDDLRHLAAALAACIVVTAGLALALGI